MIVGSKYLVPTIWVSVHIPFDSQGHLQQRYLNILPFISLNNLCLFENKQTNTGESESLIMLGKKTCL